MMSRSAKTLIVLTFALLVFGLVMLSSAGIVDGQKKFGSSYYYFLHQLLYGVLPGLVIFWILSRVNYKFWKRMALPLLLAAIGLLILVFVPGIGFGLKGAQRWIHLGVFTFQPSELLKVALIVYLAAWFSSWHDRQQKWSYSIIPFFVIMGFIWILFIKQPDVGTLGIITIIAFGMYFLAGAKFKQISLFIGAILLILAAVVFTTPYRFDRISAFLNRAEDPQGVSYHINQSLIGIGSGGIFGLGYGQSKQKFSYLPEPVGDSIFSIIGEELGLVGMTLVLGLFVALVLVMVRIARDAPDSFGRLYILGMAVWIASQAFINIAAISGLIPLTGVPLPFISYGGTSLIVLMAGLGISVNIAKHT